MTFKLHCKTKTVTFDFNRIESKFHYAASFSDILHRIIHIDIRTFDGTFYLCAIYAFIMAK